MGFFHGFKTSYKKAKSLRPVSKKDRYANEYRKQFNIEPSSKEVKQQRITRPKNTSLPTHGTGSRGLKGRLGRFARRKVRQ